MTLNIFTGSEDKLWADVDKDIGELLREVDPQGNEGSDDDEDLGRYVEQVTCNYLYDYFIILLIDSNYKDDDYLNTCQK